MSMYSQLLVAALDQPTASKDEPAAGAALIRLMRCRERLGVGSQVQDENAGAYETVRDYLAHDIALIEFSRLLGIECHADEFEQPEKARVRLEDALSDRGVSLEQADEDHRL